MQKSKLLNKLLIALWVLGTSGLVPVYAQVHIPITYGYYNPFTGDWYRVYYNDDGSVKVEEGNVISGNHFVQTTSSQGTTIGRDRRGNHWLHHFVQWHRLHWQGQNPHLYHSAQCAYLRRTQPLTVNLLSANCREGQVTGKTSCIR